jgi:hypothetical protein
MEVPAGNKKAKPVSRDRIISKLFLRGEDQEVYSFLSEQRSLLTTHLAASSLSSVLCLLPSVPLSLPSLPFPLSLLCRRQRHCGCVCRGAVQGVSRGGRGGASWEGGAPHLLK